MPLRARRFAVQTDVFDADMDGTPLVQAARAGCDEVALGLPGGTQQSPRWTRCRYSLTFLVMTPVSNVELAQGTCVQTDQSTEYGTTDTFA
jgi:hypothetical protein